MITDFAPLLYINAENATKETAVQKIIRNGQVLILRGDKTYTAVGVEIR